MAISDITSRADAAHLLRRAGFGGSSDEIAALAADGGSGLVPAWLDGVAFARPPLGPTARWMSGRPAMAYPIGGGEVPLILKGDTVSTTSLSPGGSLGRLGWAVVGIGLFGAFASSSAGSAVDTAARINPAVGRLLQRGTATGLAADRFDPEQPVMWARTATFLWRSAGGPASGPGRVALMSPAIAETNDAWTTR